MVAGLVSGDDGAGFAVSLVTAVFALVVFFFTVVFFTVVAEPEPEPAAEPEPEPESPEERRNRVHEEGRAALDEMKSE